ncbi:hypothetical protein SteCoe_6056 [Stentor coeruleus]|uniref:GST N-terminal domain-containing protein n=1 Tax=Stentor coeruleus TaxID=5963 RepID=A0A1R2CQV3_9CILI|nr:hypothetical protein SteCoe_6056 [Stentor coeruleus]
MSNIKIELIVHPLCPYAQRALHTAVFKSIPVEIIHVSLAKPEAWFIDINPLGEVPSCRVTKNNQIYKLTESLNISEFLDSFPGPSLYPKLENGLIDPIVKCMIDNFIKLKIGRYTSAYPITNNSSPSDEEIAEVKSSIAEISSYVEGGNYVMHKILGKNEITFADVMMLPHTERFYVFKNQITRFLDGVDCSSLWTWYEKVSAEPWARVNTNPVQRLLNFRRIRTQNYQGLDLPLSLYD